MPSIDLPGGRKLTETQVRALRLKLEGMTAKEAAAALSVSQQTVTSHLTIVYRKLGTHNVLQTMQRLKELGLLESVMGETEKEPAAE